MRVSPLLALLVAALPGVVPAAHAAPTVEEQALAAALQGRPGDAVRLLDRDVKDPSGDLRWTAGRHALLTRDYAAAARLFAGPELRDVWGRIDLAAARGDLANAAALALVRMDEALAGAHRDALGGLLVGWAGERAATDPDGAVQFLRAAIGLVPSAAVRHAAEDALFRLPPALAEGDTLQAARRRLAEDPANVPARLRVAMGLAASRPGTAATWLAGLVQTADRADAMAAATHLVGLDVPDPIVLAALDVLGERFPEDADVARLRLAYAITVATHDAEAGVAALQRMEGVAVVAEEAREARARATRDPGGRRALWLAIAEREGASARGDAARAEAYVALVEGVWAAPEGPARRAAAEAALATPDGAGTADLLHLAIPSDPVGDGADRAARTTALWALAARFPEGAWCDELGDRLVTDGADRAEAERFAATCTSPSGVGASVLYAHAVGSTVLHLAPRLRAGDGRGGVDVRAASADVLHVSQHRVDAEALFRATTGNPLDATLDAFLLEPDQTWDVRLPEGSVRTMAVSPRGGGGLVALTVRADEQRATALVVAEPLDVQVVRRGGDVAFAVLRGEAPVRGADLLVLDAAGVAHRARTDAGGIVVLHGRPDALRVMARKGEALGFAVVSTAEAEETVADTWSIVPWDRAVPAAGAEVDVSVFGTRPAGSASGATASGATAGGGAALGRPRLQSRDATGELLAEAPITLVDGVARARLFVAGRGSLALVEGDATHARVVIDTPREDRPLVRITWEPAAPRPGERAVATVTPMEPLGPGGLTSEVTVTTAWSTTTTKLVLGPEGAQFPVDLTTAAEPDDIGLTLRLPDGRAWSSTARVEDPRRATPGPLDGPVPAVVAVGAPFGVAVPDGGWLRATSDAGDTRWARAGAPLVLPSEGTWSLCAWVDRCGPATPVVATDGLAGDGSAADHGGAVSRGGVDAEGRWTGAPVLTAVLAEGIRSARIVRRGEALLPGVARPPGGGRTEATDASPGEARGTRQAWVRTADEGTPPLPLRGAETPAIVVTGTLARGGTSTLDVGAGLPPGTRLWAYLRDAADVRRARPATLAAPWDGAIGALGDAWSPEARWGEAIAAALLEEEERLLEATDMERVDFGFSAAAEVGSGGGLGALGTKGYGRGGGGSASHGYGGIGVRNAAEVGPLPGDPRAIGVLEGAAPGALRFDVPTWIGAADLEVVARTPDGRWASRVVRLDVGGAPLAAMPRSEGYAAPTTWDGTPASLVPLARTLPLDARMHALAALAKGNAPGAEAARRAAWANGGALSGPAVVLARLVSGGGPGVTRSSDLEALPDLRRAERAAAALALAAADPDRARAAAARLLRTPELEPWARARAGLALHVAGAADDARAALLGDEPVVAAARAVVLGTADPRFAAAWWTTARADAADPADRALAIHALTLLGPTRPVAALPTIGADAALPPGAAPLALAVEAPLAAWRGETFPRGRYVPDAGIDAGPHADLAAPTAPLGRVVPTWITVPASPVPTRLACPVAGPDAGAPGDDASRWISLAPAAGPRSVRCDVHVRTDGAISLDARWYGPDGAPLAEGRAPLRVEPARDSAPTDAMSARERLRLGLRLASAAPPTEVAAGLALLERLLAEVALPAAELEEASTAILAARSRGGKDGGGKDGGDPAALVEAFQGYREHVPNGALGLDTAAALAHAYAAGGDPTRALAATRVVMDARFKEELGAVSQLQDAGLGLTALKLLRELVDRYPEVPTVVTARYLAPSMLLGRAEGDGDRLGYTRSSLRHTAAAELATFLLLHPDAAEAPEAAALLVDALHALDDPARERALAGPLARRYRDGAAAWRLSLADARATLAAGQPAVAARILDALVAPSEGVPEIELERGRALEALGRLDDARAAYDRSGSAEAGERRAWLDRDDLALPATLVITPGTPARVKGNLRPGAEVTVTAIRVVLEAALLRDGGALDAASLEVAGLRPTASRTVTVGIDGDVLLPALPDGAYVVTVTTGGTSGRMVVVRTDAELVVESRVGAGTLVHLTDTFGEPLADAQLWLFDGGGGATTARTDGGGAAFVPYGDGALGVLAKRGDRYALANLDGGAAGAYGRQAPNPAPPARGYDEVLRKNEAAYDQLFQQESSQKIGASSL